MYNLTPGGVGLQEYTGALSTVIQKVQTQHTQYYRTLRKRPGHVLACTTDTHTDTVSTLPQYPETILAT